MERGEKEGKILLPAKLVNAIYLSTKMSRKLMWHVKADVGPKRVRNNVFQSIPVSLDIDGEGNRCSPKILWRWSFNEIWMNVVDVYASRSLRVGTNCIRFLNENWRKLEKKGRLNVSWYFCKCDNLFIDWKLIVLKVYIIIWQLEVGKLCYNSYSTLFSMIYRSVRMHSCKWFNILLLVKT